MKLGLFSVVALGSFVGYAQEVALTTVDAASLPLPEHWKSNALIVLTVNFLLGITAYGVRKIPGKVGGILASLWDLLSANVAHKDKK